MDFSLTDEQQAVVSLADQILGDRCTLERLKEVSGGEPRLDLDLWAELVKADLVGLAVPERFGGGGYGFLEVCLLLEQVGRHVAPVPYWATAIAALAVARFGTDDQQQRLLPGVATGDAMLSFALEEVDAEAREPYTSARADGVGWVLDGTKILVPAASTAAAMVVSARLEDGRIGLFLVEPGAQGVTIEPEDNMGQWSAYQVTLAGVQVGSDSVLGDPDDGTTLGWLVDRAVVGLCAVSAGACERGLRITADYATERKQFDRPIGSFQAVGQRLADAYIDAEAVRLTMQNAASLLDAGTEADHEVATAKFWASDGASRVVHAALHVHGGVSIDIDYPIQRYFLWAKQIEAELGSATPQLVRLGAIIAAEPV